jgi:hypothetical protein
MAGYMPASLERIGEGEGFRAGLHLSAMIERPRGNHDRAAPGMASRGVQVPVDGALTITSGARRFLFGWGRFRPTAGTDQVDILSTWSPSAPLLTLGAVEAGSF